MESANLICGDTGGDAAPGQTTHLTLAELKLPGMEENYVDFLPGGAPVAIEVNTHINRLEASFNLNGWQPEVMGLLASSDINQQVFTAYGLIRNRVDGTASQAMAIMGGRLGRVNPTAFRKGDLMVYEFAIRSITFYELYMARNGEQNSFNYPIYKWDFFGSKFEVTDINGVVSDINADMINILAIPETTVG
jgi:phage tail tube protein FII